jgi:hypothetical protein
MKEGAGEEDATRPPLALYPHVLGLRLFSFRDQFVDLPNRKIKEDPRDRPEEVTPRPEIRFAVVVLALLGLVVVVAIALLARLAENAFVAERLTFDLFVADVTLDVAVAGRASGLRFPRAAIVVVLPLTLLWIAPFEARLRVAGYPKAGKWQHDDDCCAGEAQAACAAGYRYVKGDVCHEEVECKAFSYECELCQPGETCDSNYNVETEEGEDYDCKQNLWSGCYFLWPMAWILVCLAIQRVNKLMADGKQSEAKAVWIQGKWAAFVIFLACSFLHFIAELWMGLYGVGLILPYCFFLGACIPLACCYYGDRVVGIPFTKGFLRDLPFRASETPATQMVTTSAPFKEYDEPPVVTRLASESNITKT